MYRFIEATNLDGWLNFNASRFDSGSSHRCVQLGEQWISKFSGP